MKTLDRSRPFGEVYPLGLYEQDGIVFNRDGTQHAEPLPEPVAEPVAPVVEDDPPEARRIDLRLKENAHLRPSAQARKAAGK